MFDANNVNNYGMGMMGGMTPPMMQGFQYQGAQQPVQKFNNILSAEEINRLRQKSTEFSLAITDEEMLRGICNHRNPDGVTDALVFDPSTGIAQCTICGYKFKPIESDVSLDEIKEDTSRIVDILQTIKLMYIDLPAEAAKNYFPIIPLIEKIPQLFEFAAKNMTKHEANSWMYNNRNMGAINMFQNLQSMLGGGMGMMMNYGQQAAPQMGQPFMPQPGMAPQQAPMGYPGMTNGFGYPGAGMATPQPGFNPVPTYAPQTNGFQFVPGQQPTAAPQAPVAPAAPQAPADGTTTVTQNVSV